MRQRELKCKTECLFDWNVSQIEIEIQIQPVAPNARHKWTFNLNQLSTDILQLLPS